MKKRLAWFLEYPPVVSTMAKICRVVKNTMHRWIVRSQGNTLYFLYFYRGPIVI